MTQDADATTSGSRRSALAGAAAAALGAGAIHAAAIGVHDEHRAAVVTFSIVAALQIGWGALALQRSGRLMAAAGTAIGLGAVGGWLLAKTSGLPGIAGLDQAEAVQWADGVAAVLAAASVVLAFPTLLVGDLSEPTPSTLPRWAAGPMRSVGAAAVAVLAVSSMVAAGTHSHGSGGHGHETVAAHDDGHTDAAAHDEADHADGDVHAESAVHDDDHATSTTHDDHTADVTHDDDHDDDDPPDATHDDHTVTPPHDDDHPTTTDGHTDHPTTTTEGHTDHPPIIEEPEWECPSDRALPAGTPIDLGGRPGVTAPQQAAAEDLVELTLARLPQFADPEAAEAAGWSSIGDGFTGHEHLINWDLLDDGRILDPDYPEALVYDTCDGGRTLVSAMFMLEPGSTLDTVPELGGSLTQWHIHDNLCFTGGEDPVVAGITNANGSCTPPLQKLTPVPMIHVWITSHPCGPFAALEGVAAGSIRPGEERLCDTLHGH